MHALDGLQSLERTVLLLPYLGRWLNQGVSILVIGGLAVLK